jgi:eukaryotic-like serine/threonine-protein kinase
MEGPGVGNAQSSLIGATIGNYRVVAKLGEGGMGSVYLAEHPLIGKKVALKVLHDEYSANQDVVARFFNEAKAVNDIQHPNIVDIIDYGVVQTQHGPGFVYFIMEFLAGESLSSCIQRESPMPPERAFGIAMQVADALAASHAKGIIHRDLKPDNIYLVTRGREKDIVKVLDFGIAKLTGDAPGSRRTRTGIVMGTPAYMSPEQCEGKGNIDARTDVYALGIVLYEMITGRVPFAGEGYGEVLVQHLTKRPARPTTARGAVQPHVEAVIMKSLEKRREDRFQTMEQFIEALRDPHGYIEANGGLDAFYRPDDASGHHALGTGVMSVATPGTGMPKAPTGVAAVTRLPNTAPHEAPARSKLGVVIGGALLAFALVGGGIFLATRNKKSEPPAPPLAQAQPAPTPPLVQKQPEPTPAPAAKPPEPEAPKTVAITVATSPPGASVFVGKETTAKGQTPLSLELPRGDGETTVTVRAEGFKDATRSVKLSMDAQLEIALVKERHSSSSSGSSKPKPTKPPKNPSKPGSDDVLAPSF